MTADTPKTPQAAEPARCPLCKRHPSFVGSDALGYKIWCCNHTAATIYGPNPVDTVQAWNRYVLANTAPAAASPAEPAQERADELHDNEIRAIFIAHGFTIKPAQADLKDYVFKAARALIAADRALAACAPAQSKKDKL